MSTTKTKTVSVFGDELRVSWDGNMWVSPSNGQQHVYAESAMRTELEAYYAACGDDVESDEVAEQIDGYVSQMADAE